MVLLIGFRRSIFITKGNIKLPMTFGSSQFQTTAIINFLLVNNLSIYNIIMGRPALNTFCAIPSTYHQLLKIPTEKGIGQAFGDQHEARHCYFLATHHQLDSQSIMTIKSAIIEYEDIQVDNGNLSKTLKIYTTLPLEIQQLLFSILKQNLDIFAYSNEDMLGISNEIITYKINVNPHAKPIK